MMTINDLNREQLGQVKQAYLMDTHPYVSWDELDDADALVSDETVKEAFADFTFDEDDFFTESDANLYTAANVYLTDKTFAA